MFRFMVSNSWIRAPLFCLVVTPIILGGSGKIVDSVSKSLTFPEQAWERASREELGLDNAGWDEWFAAQNPSVSLKFGRRATLNEWGAVMVKDGFLVANWGDPDYQYQSASVGKAFTKLALALAIDQGLIRSDRDRVSLYWTGEGLLSSPDKAMNKGHHKTITFQHLWKHQAGFPVTNGFYWRNKKDVPEWAEWTGDPAADNYAHRLPDQGRNYSSGGYWRLTQALTAIWQADLKTVLDEQVFSKIGIKPDSWSWLAGESVKRDEQFYPEMPGYGLFVDPPYSIDGHPCVGGGGWVVMSASDLARVGLLIANGGIWRGEELVSNSDLLDGHGGGNDSDLYVDKKKNIVFVKVTTRGLFRPNF